MELKISKEILEQAALCSREHRCLAGLIFSDPQPQVVGTKRFICRDTEPCAYKFPFGSNFFCTCPVRRAIYETYGK